MDRLDGRVFSDCALAKAAPAERRPLNFAMADAMVKLQAVDPAAIGLGDYGKPGNYFARQISRWSRQYDESPSHRIPALDRVIAWLSDNQPEEDGRVSIAHGDFRLGNMLFHPTKPQVVGILGWELSTLGHSLADLGFCCMPWQPHPMSMAAYYSASTAQRWSFPKRLSSSAGTTPRPCPPRRSPHSIVPPRCSASPSSLLASPTAPARATPPHRTPETSGRWRNGSRKGQID